VVAGVDSSTQSTKVELRKAVSGELLGSGSAPHTEVVPPVAEQDPEVWLAAFHQAFAQAKQEAGQDGQSVEVAAISVAGQQHGMVCLDAQDQVIRPAKLWCDTSSASDADWLLGQLPGGATGFAQACGSVPVAAFTITKLSWLHRNEPESWDRLSTVLLPHDWMTFALTNNKVTDRGDASGTGYWSPATNEYCWNLLRIVDSSLDWEQMLPRVLGPIEPAGEWNKILVAPGTGDNMAAALGLGLEPDEVVISLGTSGTVFCVSDHASSDPCGWVCRCHRKVFAAGVYSECHQGHRHHCPPLRVGPCCARCCSAGMPCRCGRAHSAALPRWRANTESSHLNGSDERTADRHHGQPVS